MPLRDYKGYLWDVANACRQIQTFVAGKTFDDYLSNILLRSAVERQFTILGEALAQARQHFPQVSEDISDVKEIIGFRNRMIHAYLKTDDKAVWGVVEDDLPRLLEEAQKALARLDAEDSTV